jgi:hypothetical protein
MILWGGGRVLILAPEYVENSYIYIVRRLLVYQLFSVKNCAFFVELEEGVFCCQI